MISQWSVRRTGSPVFLDVAESPGRNPESRSGLILGESG